jgi:hypothetical protein
MVALKHNKKEGGLDVIDLASAGRWLLTALAVYPLMVGTTGAQEWLYTVRPFDTLWDLSEAYLLDVSYWSRLQALNSVADPYHLPPGSRLRVPIAWLKAQPIPAQVIDVLGSAHLNRSGEAATGPVTRDVLFSAGDELHTGSDGNVTLQFGDGSQMIVRGDSHVAFDTLSMYGGGAFIDSQLRLYQGRSDVRATSTESGQSRYRIWTPAAISAVRGTDFRVGLSDARQTMRTEVLSGRVDLTARARTVSVEKGFGTIVDKGAPPRPPRALLPPPLLTGVPEVFERLPVRFQTSPLPGAVAYRLEIANQPDFTRLVFDQVSPSVTLGGIDLADGSYHLRIRGIDDVGIEGFNAGKAVLVNARPEPPLLMDPVEDGMVPDGNPVFRWTQSDDAAAYRFQLAWEGKFEHPVFAKDEIRSSSLSLDAPLAPGRYGWRVATIDNEGEVGPFSDTQRLRVPEPGPAVEPPQTSDDAIVLRWRAGLPGDTYQLQLARDKDFEQMRIDTTTTEPTATVTLPETGEYFVRVKTIEASGSEGVFGPTQNFTYQKTPDWFSVIPIFGLIAVLALL